MMLAAAMAVALAVVVTARAASVVRAAGERWGVQIKSIVMKKG